jgi:hypothetical protein
MPITYTAIASATVGAGGSSSINLTNIPQTFTDLLLATSISSNRTVAGENARTQFNSDTGSNYFTRRFFGTGSGVSSDTDSGISLNFGSNSSLVQSQAFGNGRLYIPNYTSSNQKAAISESIGEANQIEQYAAVNTHLWTGTAAITSILLTPQVGTLWIQYSSVTLYGITKS